MKKRTTIRKSDSKWPQTYCPSCNACGDSRKCRVCKFTKFPKSGPTNMHKWRPK